MLTTFVGQIETLQRPATGKANMNKIWLREREQTDRINEITGVPGSWKLPGWPQQPCWCLTSAESYIKTALESSNVLLSIADSLSLRISTPSLKIQLQLSQRACRLAYPVQAEKVPCLSTEEQTTPVAVNISDTVASVSSVEFVDQARLR